MEDSLTAGERKRFLKTAEEIPLELAQDGGFVHNRSTKGTFTVAPNVIWFRPESVQGLTLEVMQKAAEDAGREFGLAWLFTPFELLIKDTALVTADEKSVIYTEYLKSSG